MPVPADTSVLVLAHIAASVAGVAVVETVCALVEAVYVDRIDSVGFGFAAVEIVIVVAVVLD